MKRILCVVFTAACILAAFSGGSQALDTRPSSLTVTMEYNGAPLRGLRIAVRQVASAQETNGVVTFSAVPAFSGAGANFSNLTKERNIALAASLDAYASANGIDRTSQLTDAQGKASFTGLSAGLYLVAQADGETSEYIIAPYLAVVPAIDEKTGEWEHNVISYPKTEPLKRAEATSISVYKVWKGSAPPPGGVLVQLYRNGVPYGNCVTLHAGNNWSHTWTNLNPGGTWTVDEFDVPEGYTKSISGNAAGGFVITNTRVTGVPQRTVVGGTKTWEHGSNPVGQRPESIVLQIKANGTLILQKAVGEAEHWSWSIRMDEYGKDGKKIVYTVDEAPVEGYTKTVSGYSLLNVHRSCGGPSEPTTPGPTTPGPTTPGPTTPGPTTPGPTTPGPTTPGPTTPGGSAKPGGTGSQPKTNDLSNPALWLAAMGFSLIGLAAIFIFFWRQRRREKNSA